MNYNVADLNSKRTIMAQRILVVDDEPGTLKMLEMTIKLEGYEVATARDWQVALLMIPEFKPDLIILDVMMPGQTGIEVLKTLKKQYANPPTVIFFSAKSAIPDMVEGMEAGAFKYLVKPVSRADLIQNIKSALVARAFRKPSV